VSDLGGIELEGSGHDAAHENLGDAVRFRDRPVEDAAASGSDKALPSCSNESSSRNSNPASADHRPLPSPVHVPTSQESAARSGCSTSLVTPWDRNPPEPEEILI
jgi:hypothetical protein